VGKHNRSNVWEQFHQRMQEQHGLPFGELLAAEKVKAVLNKLDVQFRECVFTPITTLWVFLWQVLSPDHSCRDAVGRLLAWRLAQGKSPCSTETTSYCQARQRLPIALLQTLVRDTSRELEQSAPPGWLWKNRHVKAGDGTTVTMPDTPVNQAAFPQSRNQAPGVGFPLARLMIIVSLATGLALELAIGPTRGKKTGENTMFRGIQDVLEPGDIFLGDRYFCSYRDIARLRERNVDVVLRQHQTRHTDFRCGRWLATGDHIVVWTRPQFNAARFTREEWEALPPTMAVREIRYRVVENGFRTREIVVVTTLLDPSAYPAEDLAGLYRQRWNCELDLRSLKTSLQMNHLRCKSPEMVEKEIWAHVLAYNLMRQTMAAAAEVAAVPPRQLSFKGTVQMVNHFTSYLAVCPLQRAQLWHELLRAIATHRVGDRLNRVEPRKLKHRLAKYTYMTRPRNEERQKLCA